MSKRRVIGKTWWAQRWLDSLQGCDFENRLPRGKSYYAQGRIIEIEFNAKACRIEALVEGSQYYPYEVTLGLKPIDSEKANELINAIAENSEWVAALLDHRLPPEIAKVCEKLSIELFPTNMHSLSIDCTCPDSAHLCKHVACVIYALADLIDTDPFIIFSLRGLPLVERLKKLGIERLAMGTPYPNEVNEVEVRFLADSGIQVVKAKGLGIHHPPLVSHTTTDALRALVAEVDCAEAQAIFVSCTGLLVVDLIPELENTYNKPVITSNQATLWLAMKKLGRKDPVPLGTLFTV